MKRNCLLILAYIVLLWASIQAEPCPGTNMFAIFTNKGVVAISQRINSFKMLKVLFDTTGTQVMAQIKIPYPVERMKAIGSNLLMLVPNDSRKGGVYRFCFGPQEQISKDPMRNTEGLLPSLCADRYNCLRISHRE